MGGRLISLLGEVEEEESQGSDVKSPDVSQSARPFSSLKIHAPLQSITTAF